MEHFVCTQHLNTILGYYIVYRDGNTDLKRSTCVWYCIFSRIYFVVFFSALQGGKPFPYTGSTQRYIDIDKTRLPAEPGTLTSSYATIPSHEITEEGTQEMKAFMQGMVSLFAVATFQ